MLLFFNFSGYNFEFVLMFSKLFTLLLQIFNHRFKNLLCFLHFFHRVLYNQFIKLILIFVLYCFQFDLIHACNLSIFIRTVQEFFPTFLCPFQTRNYLYIGSMINHCILFNSFICTFNIYFLHCIWYI